MPRSGAGLCWTALCLLLAAVGLALPGAHGDEPPPSTKGEIPEFIAKLGSPKFAVREKAQRALLQIGKPALGELHKALRAGENLEVQLRARQLIAQIDPGAARREALKALRTQLTKEVKEVAAARRGAVDARNWGEDIANPFTNLTEEGKKKLRLEGIDVDRLARLRAVLITGNYCGANAVTLVNRDPETVLVLGKGFITHDGVHSLGPVLAVEDAHIMGSLTGADLVWFVEKSFPRFSVKGVPLLAGPETPEPHDRRVTAVLRRGDYGWRRPKDFLKPPPPGPAGKLPPLAVADTEKKRKQLRAWVAGAGGTTTADCQPVANPFTNLSPEGKARLTARGVAPERLAKLKAVLLTGSYAGAGTKNFVNRDPGTVLVIDGKFFTHGEVYSAGPVLAVGGAHFMGNVTGADLVWFVEESFPRGTITGLPVILSPSASRSQMSPGSADVWHGDYGWRRPANFRAPASKPVGKGQ
jgi:hypothetical protein